MDDREALLTGVVHGLLAQVVADPESPFTYAEVAAVPDGGGHFTNVLKVTAADGAVLTVTVEHVS